MAPRQYIPYLIQEVITQYWLFDWGSKDVQHVEVRLYGSAVVVHIIIVLEYYSSKKKMSRFSTRKRNSPSHHSVIQGPKIGKIVQQIKSDCKINISANAKIHEFYFIFSKTLLGFAPKIWATSPLLIFGF